MSERLRLRRAVRGLVLDPAHRVLLVRFEFPHATVWAAPGGGLEPDEEPVAALRRELREEVGLVAAEIGPAIWIRTHVFPFLDGSHDGQMECFYLVRAARFEPRPAISWEALRAEHVTAIRWWSADELRAANESFAPRRLPQLVSDLLDRGPPPAPIEVGV